ncbi:unnamed protein product [Lampetra fluviatilis]
MLAQAAYTRMDKEGLDALVLDCMLGLAQELDVALPTTDNDDLTSLRVARSIQTHLIGKRRAKVVACAGPAKEESDDEGEPSQAFASLNEGGCRKNRPGRRDDRDQRTGASSRPASSPVMCFKCSNPGHISKRCRTDPGSTSRASASSGHLSSGPQGSQASRAAPHTRPSHSHHASMTDIDRHSQEGWVSGRPEELERASADVSPQDSFVIPPTESTHLAPSTSQGVPVHGERGSPRTPSPDPPLDTLSPREMPGASALVAEMDVEELEEDVVVREGQMDRPAVAIS